MIRESRKEEHIEEKKPPENELRRFTMDEPIQSVLDYDTVQFEIDRVGNRIAYRACPLQKLE